MDHAVGVEVWGLDMIGETISLDPATGFSFNNTGVLPCLLWFVQLA